MSTLIRVFSAAVCVLQFRRVAAYTFCKWFKIFSFQLPIHSASGLPIHSARVSADQTNPKIQNAPPHPHTITFEGQDKRQKTKDKRQKTKDKRQKTKDKTKTKDF
jgi:hypothetical protein